MSNAAGAKRIKMGLGCLAVLFLAAIRAFGDDADERYHKATDEQARADWKASLVDFNRVIELKPSFVPAYYDRASVRQTNGDWEGALDDLNQAIKLSPKFVGAYFDRGNLKSSKNDLDGALADFNKVIELSPDFAEAYSIRGEIWRHLNDPDAALADFNQAIKYRPDSPVDYFNRGMAKKAKGDWDGATADFNQAIRLQSGPLVFVSAYCGRAQVKMYKGDLTGALADLDDVIRRSRNYGDGYQFRGLVKFDLGDYEGALTDFKRARQLNLHVGWTYFSQGLLHYDTRDYNDALKDFHDACAQTDQEPQDYGHFRIWLIRARTGEKEAATAELKDYLKNRAPIKHLEWRVAIGRFLTGELTGDELLKSAPNPDKFKNDCQFCEAWFYIGSKRLIEGDTDAAVDCFKKCRATQMTSYHEYRSAAAELKFLGEQK